MTLPDLAAIVREAGPEDLPRLIGDLEAAKAAAWARLAIPAAAKTTEAGPTADMNVDAREAARRLGISRDWLYRNATRLPFTVRIGRRVLFSTPALERWSRSRATR
jgi:predicted DNA-binding transcriptional regulator AlpA